MFSEEGYHSPTVSAVVVGEDVTVEQVLRRARKSGFVVSGGYGKLKGITFRIGHMGDHSVEGVERLLASLG
jgi:aspartate aminotransferase-like enzyme